MTSVQAHASLGKRGCPSKTKNASDSDLKGKYDLKSISFTFKIFRPNSPNFIFVKVRKREIETLQFLIQQSQETSQTSLILIHRLSKSSSQKESQVFSRSSSTASSPSMTERTSSEEISQVLEKLLPSLSQSLST